VATVGFIGVLGLVFNKPLMKIVLKKFEKRKHLMAVGFREL
jgi:hypothetical protein